ncbi:GntR family transcriptional regulator [Lachnospiraceae bacterium KK002]
MPWNLNSDRPIFIQIIEKIQMDIISGLYRPGDKLPSVRELAQEASVNPNTMQKALSELERTGLVYSQRTSGRFITEDMTMIEKLKSELAKEMVTQFLENMLKLGFQKEDAISLLTELTEQEGGSDDTAGM